MHLPETLETVETCCKDLTLQTAKVAMSCSAADLFTHGCPRKYLLQNRLGIQSAKQALQKGKTVGTFTHALLAHGYTQPQQDAEEQVHEKTVKPLAEERSQLAKADKLGTYDGDAALIDEAWNLSKVMANYFWKAHPLDRDKLTVMYVETTLVAPLLNGYPVAIIDLVLADEERKVAWVSDHKTSTSKPAAMVGGLSWALQSYIYPSLVEAALAEDGKEDYTVPGMIYNLLQKPTIRFCKKDKDFEAYCERVAGEYEKKDYKPMESIPIPSQAWIDNLSGVQSKVYNTIIAGNLPLHLDDSKQIGRTFNFFYCDSNNCRGKYDDRLCPYLPFCNTHPDAWAQLLGDGPFVQKFDRPVPTENSESVKILTTTTQTGDANDPDKDGHPNIITP